MTAVRFCDELDFTVGWIHPDPDWMERAGHAVLSGGGVWVIDPVDGDGVEDGSARSASPPASYGCSTGTRVTARRSLGGSACRSTTSRSTA